MFVSENSAELSVKTNLNLPPPPAVLYNPQAFETAECFCVGKG